MAEARAPLAIDVTHDRQRAAIRFSHATGNILTCDVIDRMRGVLNELHALTDLKLVTIEGAGDDFSFGASIPEHLPGEIDRALPALHGLIEDLLAFPAPTGVVVRGRCLGGGFELALACDFIFASEDASFALPEIRLGVFPPAATVLLPWRVGGARATRAVLLGQACPARKWADSGLIELVAAAPDLGAAVDRWFVDELGPKSAAALRHAAAAIRRGLRDALAAQLPALERQYLEDLMQTADAVEGVSAFLQKRPPRWQNR